MHIKFKTLQMNLFIYYSVFFTLIMLVIALLIYIYFSNFIISKASEQQTQLCTSISNSLNDEESKLETVSLNIIYSTLIQNNFRQYLLLQSVDPSNNLKIESEKYTNITSLMDVVMAIIGPFTSVSQANIYDLNGDMVGAGIFNGNIKVDFINKPWYQKTIQLNGFSYLSDPINDYLLDFQNFPNNMNQKYMSLTRVYKDDAYNNLGIVETIQSCDTLFKYVNNIKSSNNNLSIYVINSNSDCIYPYQGVSDPIGKYYNSLIISENLNQLKISDVNSPIDKSKQILTYMTSDTTGLKTIIVTSKNNMFYTLNKFNSIFFLLFAFVILVTLLISYIISRKITVPLKKLRHALNGIEIDNLPMSFNGEIQSSNNSVEEIDRLYNTFNTMNQKLRKSLNELLITKNEEMNAKILAMQSQMNPHFLYNNLATISAMAEEGMDNEIVLLCSDISCMLRYISTESRNGVMLRDEIENAEKYLNCMKIRFEENLDFEIKIDEKLLNILIPKLSVQPLVENSLKHGLKNSPPWHISINGKIDGDKWAITVTDNGVGFDPLVLNNIKKFSENAAVLTELPNLQIEGMGLSNIFLRLKLLYKEDAVFDLNNLPGGGASVTIGGNTKIQ